MQKIKDNIFEIELEDINEFFNTRDETQIKEILEL